MKMTKRKWNKYFKKTVQNMNTEDDTQGRSVSMVKETANEVGRPLTDGSKHLPTIPLTKN